MKKHSLFGILLTAIIMTGCATAGAITPNQATSNEYLSTHGYSADMIKMVNVEKSRVSGTKLQIKKPNPAVFYLKNILLGRDLTEEPKQIGD